MAKVALVSSAGGHLSQVLAAVEGCSDRHEFFLCVTGFETVQNMRLDGVSRIYAMPVYWRYQRPFGVMVSLAASLASLLRVFLKERPDYLITTGAEIALPALLVNRLLFRRPSLYIESVSRTDRPSLTGRVAARFASRVFVQWPEMLEFYGPRAEYQGRLI